MADNNGTGYQFEETHAVLKFVGTAYHGAEVTVSLDIELGTYLDMESMRQTEQFREMVEPFAAYLISWNLKDKDGAPLSADFEGLKHAPLKFVPVLIQEWLEAVANPPSPLSPISSNGDTSEAVPSKSPSPSPAPSS